MFLKEINSKWAILHVKWYPCSPKHRYPHSSDDEKCLNFFFLKKQVMWCGSNVESRKSGDFEIIAWKSMKLAVYMASEHAHCALCVYKIVLQTTCLGRQTSVWNFSSSWDGIWTFRTISNRKHKAFLHEYARLDDFGMTYRRYNWMYRSVLVLKFNSEGHLTTVYRFPRPGVALLSSVASKLLAQNGKRHVNRCFTCFLRILQHVQVHRTPGTYALS